MICRTDSSFLREIPELLLSDRSEGHRVSPVPQGTTTMPPTDRKGTLFGGDAVHVALILQTRATARRARNALSRLLRRYHAAEPASARDRGTIVRKHISGLHRRGVSTAVHSAWVVSPRNDLFHLSRRPSARSARSRDA